MPRFRLFLAWLLMAALPLQGLAAASMLFCGNGVQNATVAAPAVWAADESHANAQHHSGHDHAAQVQVQKATDGSGIQLPDAAHECGICASCCSGLAITAVHFQSVVAPLPQAESAEPFVLIHARATPVPDKPPRA